ncbi:hypothetical protein Tco_1045917 [Tanacetum coccineum]
MSTLVEFMIVAGADNRPPMLDKTMYDSWESHMDLFIEVDEHGNSRVKKYEKLSATKKLQADCDLRATNLVFQGLPPNVYSLVNHYRVAKYIWDRVKLLIQGTSLTKQEHECKLYDEFNKFTHIKGETIHQYYLSKFVTVVKLAKYLHTTNYDQLHANLQQHEIHTNEIRLNHEDIRNLLLWLLTIILIHLTLTIKHHAMFLVNQLPSTGPPQSYLPSPVVQQPHVEVHQPALNIFVPTFQQGDDLIECINKAMALLTAGRQVQNYDGNGTQGNAISIVRNNAAGQGKTTIPQNAAFQTEDLDPYNFDCDDVSSAKVVLMANLSSCNLDVLSEIPCTEYYQPELINDHVQ